MGCSPEDLPEAMNDREKWWERVKDIHATSTTWWWWYIYMHTFLYMFPHKCQDQSNLYHVKKGFIWLPTKSDLIWNHFIVECHTQIKTYLSSSQKMLVLLNISLLGCLRCWVVNFTLLSKYYLRKTPPGTRQLILNHLPFVKTRWASGEPLICADIMLNYHYAWYLQCVLCF